MPIVSQLTLASGEASGPTQAFLIVFATAAVVTLTLRHLRVATIPAYLLAGVLVGPALGLVAEESVDSIADLAIILLMFGIGLHMDLKELTGDLLPIFAIGAIATVAVTLMLWPAGMAFGLSAPSALAIAMALSMSSTAAVLRTLQQRREMKSSHGRMCFGVLIVQDLLAIAFLSLIPTLAGWAALNPAPAIDHAGTGGVGDLLLQSLITIGGVAVIIAAGRFVLPKVLAFAAKDASPDVLLIVAGAVALGAAVLTGLLGLSPELGAFLAGFLLASTPFKHQVSGQLAPLRDLFMAIFFVAVGLRLPLTEVLDLWWVVLLASAGCVAIKALGNAGFLWAGGVSAPVAAAAGLALAQAGEFSLVLLKVAGEKFAINPSAEAAAIGVVAITLMLTPALISAGRALGPRLSSLPTVRILPVPAVRTSDDEAALAAVPADTPAKPDRAIIAGYGPVGRAVAQRLELLGDQVVIIELNPSTVKKQGLLGREVVYGDVSNPEVLESAGVHDADAFISTIPDDDATFRAIRAVRHESKTIFIAVRSTFLSKGLQARQLGADHVTIEEIATAEAMAEQVHKELTKRKVAKEQGAIAAAARNEAPEPPNASASTPA